MWKQVVGMTKEIEALKKRVELLEKSQNAAPKADQCPKCRGLSFRLERTELDPTFGDVGVQRDVYQCGSCGYSRFEQRT